MREFHDKPLAGHFVRFKTYHKIRDDVTTIGHISLSCLYPNDLTVVNCIVKGHASLSPPSLRLRLYSQTNDNKIDRERQRAGASAQNEWRRGTEANMRRSPKVGRGGLPDRQCQIEVHETHRCKSDEAHFWLNGYVNKQSCCIWSEANPQVYVETPLHPEKLTVWCALCAGRIIGPYFFKNDEGHNVTVNGDRYRAMITKFFIPELNNQDVQDGATCHTARAAIDLLKYTFGVRLISRFGPVNGPTRSFDLTPLGYFL
ncbi:DDE_3 domain-containing protein [Trichonephila clavipes]|nr:DDE_3 domain-containing protein [Trichonephila clavipes]